MTVRNPGRRALLYGGPAIAAGAVVLAGSPAAAATADVVSPKDFGAVGDGVTDDTAAVNRCLAASRAIDFGGPQNTYLITGTLLADQAVSQVLVGYGATVKAGASPDGMLRLKNGAHTVSGLVFDGKSQPGKGFGIKVESTAVGSTVADCTLVAVAEVGIQVDAAHTTISGNVLRQCGRAVAKTASVNVAGADFVTVTDNELLDCDWGVYFRAVSDTNGTVVATSGYYTCAGNLLTCGNAALTASQGISNQLGHHGRIQNNTIVGFVDNSIDCWGCNNITITGNNATGGKDGVFLGDQSSRSITVTGNTFSGHQRGVRVVGSIAGALVIGIVVTGNTITAPTLGGILLQEDAGAQVTGITVADNDVHLAGSGTFGIQLINAECSRVTGNRVYRPKGSGIILDGTDMVEVSQNLLLDAGYAVTKPETQTIDAITVKNANRAMIRNNTAYGSARYAVAITVDKANFTATGMTVTGTRWRVLTGSTGILDQAANTILADNIGL